MGAIRPYLPEFVRPTKETEVSWRASKLPFWHDIDLSIIASVSIPRLTTTGGCLRDRVTRLMAS